MRGTFHIPLNAGEGDFPHSSERKLGRQTKQRRSKMSKVLIVEDDELIAELERDYLEAVLKWNWYLREMKD